MIPALVVAVVIYSLPWFVYAIVKLVQRVLRQNIAKETDANALRLRECRARATRLRRRVKLILMSTAWLLVCMYLWTAPIPIFMSAKREMFEPPLWPGTFNFCSYRPRFLWRFSASSQTT